MPLKDGTRNELEPRPLPLSPEARKLWIEFADSVERQLGPSGDLQPISGFAAKLPEHAARIAGVLSMFENPDASLIDAAALEVASRFHVTMLRPHFDCMGKVASTLTS